MTFAHEAWPFVLPVALVAIALAALRLWLPAMLVAAVALLVLGFFRVPGRETGGGGDTLLSAADGKVMAVDRITVPELGDRSPQGAWEEDGSKDMLARAHDKAVEVLSSHYPTYIDARTDAAIRERFPIRLPAEAMGPESGRW